MRITLKRQEGRYPNGQRNRRHVYLSSCNRFKIQGDGRGYFKLSWMMAQPPALPYFFDETDLTLTQCKIMAEGFSNQLEKLNAKPVHNRGYCCFSIGFSK